MPEPQRFPYTVNNSEWGEASLMPYLPLTLMANQKSANISALVDSGAAASILPYDVGLQLGFVWEAQKTIVNLSGNLAGLKRAALCSLQLLVNSSLYIWYLHGRDQTTSQQFWGRLIFSWNSRFIFIERNKCLK